MRARVFRFIRFAAISYIGALLLFGPASAHDIRSQNSFETPAYSEPMRNRNSAEQAPHSSRQNSDEVLVLPGRQTSDAAKQNTEILEGCWRGAFNDMANFTILDPQTAILYRTGRCPLQPFIVSYRFCAKDVGGVENISTYDSLMSAPGTYGYQELDKKVSFDAQSGHLSLVIVSTMRSARISCTGGSSRMYKYVRTLAAAISGPGSLRATFEYKQFDSLDGGDWSPLFAGSDTQMMLKD